MIILGINAFHGDASAALVADGNLIAAAEEERFTRIKHCAGFPIHAIRYCLRETGVSISQVRHVAISRKPSAHLYKKILFAIGNSPSLDLIKNRLANASKIHDTRSLLAQYLQVLPEFISAQIHAVEHHRAHLASSFYVSPFERAALLSVDGFGDFVSSMWGIGEDTKMSIKGWVEFPHSIGLLYTAITQFLGFLKYGDEYKVMGLASYGEPEYEQQMKALLHCNNGLDFRLNLDYFLHHTKGVQMTWESGYPELSACYSNSLTSLIGPVRDPQHQIESRHQNIAASLQNHLEEVLFHMLNTLYEKTKCENLCLAGGVALNCVANGKITDHTPFKRIYIQPAANDSGTAIGAAFYVYNNLMNRPRGFVMEHSYWGPAYGNYEIETALRSTGLPYHRIEAAEQRTELAATRIAEGKVVGWFQGRMEFGPRALGNRSILVDPRRPEMKATLNARIKHREPFRPFAPSIKEDRTAEYFEKSDASPFMLMTYKVKYDKRNTIPAPTHVDGTGRLQTVSIHQNPLYWSLHDAFERKTGVPVLLNTSFNENEPIVNSPQEAIECFQRTKMDVIFLESYFAKKAAK